MLKIPGPEERKVESSVESFAIICDKQVLSISDSIVQKLSDTPEEGLLGVMHTEFDFGLKAVPDTVFETFHLDLGAGCIQEDATAKRARKPDHRD